MKFPCNNSTPKKEVKTYGGACDDSIYNTAGNATINGGNDIYFLFDNGSITFTTANVVTIFGGSVDDAGNTTTTTTTPTVAPATNITTTTTEETTTTTPTVGGTGGPLLKVEKGIFQSKKNRKLSRNNS